MIGSRRSSLVATSVASSGSSMTPMTAGSSRSVTGTPSIDVMLDVQKKLSILTLEKFRIRSTLSA